MRFPCRNLFFERKLDVIQNQGEGFPMKRFVISILSTLAVLGLAVACSHSSVKKDPAPTGISRQIASVLDPE
ncbi:MAG TPA: hypothetical protein DCS07_10065, partial [Bdellovibrionales bacterium]|nr:hypothetical protein [Bdellovibrionales bacterium]